MNGEDLGVEIPIKATRLRTKPLLEKIDRLNKENTDLTVNLENARLEYHKILSEKIGMEFKIKTIAKIAGE